MYWTLYVIVSYIATFFIVRRVFNTEFWKDDRTLVAGMVFLAAPITLIGIAMFSIVYVFVHAVELLGKLILPREKQ